jgi:hypothetical protein
VHVPVEVDVEDVEEAVAAGLVAVAADGVEEVRDDDVAPVYAAVRTMSRRPWRGAADLTTGFIALQARVRKCSACGEGRGRTTRCRERRARRACCGRRRSP